VYITRVHVYTRASLTDILARKSVRQTKVSRQVGEDPRACPAGHADFRTSILAQKLERTSESVSVSVSMSVPWNSSFMSFSQKSLALIADVTDVVSETGFKHYSPNLDLDSLGPLIKCTFY